jgi:hypothetical protein
MFSLLDFADSFGANTRDIHLKMQEVDGTRLTSYQKYREFAFADAMEVMDSAMSEFETLRNDAMDLKNNALFWVFLTQWVVVTGTSLICGFIIWSLMVRRRLYRDVGTTRLRS